MRYIFFLLALVLLSSLVSASSAMGVAPSSHNLIYTGAKIIEGSYFVYPDEEKNVRSYGVGDLKEYLTLNDGETEIRQRISEPTEIKYRLELPENLKPKDYRLKIVNSQFLSDEDKLVGGFATAFAAMSFVINVRVPNEGKFLETGMSIKPEKITVGDSILFSVWMLNFGTEDLTDLQTEIRVRDPQGVLLARLPTWDIALLEPAQRTGVNVLWKSEGHGSGIYRAEAEIDYGGKNPALTTTGFRIGDIFIEILNITSELNSTIAKIDVHVRSNWNEEIKNVYAELKVKQGEQIFDTIRTSSVNLPAWGEDVLTGFWERGQLKSGDYLLEIFVYYYDKYTQETKSVTLDALGQPLTKEQNNNFTIIIIVFLALILILNILWFFHSTRKKHKKR
ncbi:hypothetical protein GOV09_05765 [Candidatus Woesearchaeota archaeon]|nr:hypothetical protein [Candidatus Woesearchaeota archaeon]